ncbi:MAG: hypothetical protein FWD62_09825 [Betaproteobacteria bacterium]|nr:hypothetical protein [Betaproteobacteria bacterium]
MPSGDRRFFAINKLTAAPRGTSKFARIVVWNLEAHNQGIFKIQYLQFRVVFFIKRLAPVIKPLSPIHKPIDRAYMSGSGNAQLLENWRKRASNLATFEA